MKFKNPNHLFIGLIVFLLGTITWAYFSFDQALPIKATYNKALVHCQRPDGTNMYLGEAENVFASHIALVFTPKEGNYIGKEIRTTMACTWMYLPSKENAE